MSEPIERKSDAPAMATASDPPPSHERALPVLNDEELARAPRAVSVLEREIDLGELLDLKSFRDVCASFVDLYKIGIKIFDTQGTKLVDIRFGNGDWCGYIFSNPEGRGRCTGLVGKIKSHEYAELGGGEVVQQDCFSGLRYLIMPIVHGGDLLGRVIYGPFVPEELDRPGEVTYRFGDGFDAQRLWTYGGKIRRMNDKTVRKIVVNFRQVIDTIVSIAYRAVMTQHLHIESITSSYNELAEVNRALRQSLEKQQELDRMKANFLAMLSHELRTPLTSIIGYSEMLLEGMAGQLESPEQIEFITTIKEKGESLLALISSLLDVSKIESGAVAITRSDVDVAEVVSSAHRTIVPQAQKKGIGLALELAAELPRIYADREKLNQSVANLLTNAVKFTPSSGRITVRAGVYDGERKYSGDSGRFGGTAERFVRIDVLDTGIGIPADRLRDVFRPFYQVDNTFTREYGGTGLGLAIVKSFIEAHGGEVWVESREGSGTTFTLLLPLIKPPAPAKSNPPAASRSE